MKINNVVGFSAKSCIADNNLAGRNVTFGRKLKGDEKKEIIQDINSGFDILGKQVRAMIIHGPNFPQSKTGIDTGMGSPFGQQEFGDFAKTFGFTHLQLGPTGARNHNQRSHYLSSIYEKDPALVNLELLSGEDYAGILSEDELREIVEETDKSVVSADLKKGYNYTRSDFQKAEVVADKALARAYKNFTERLYDPNDADAIRLFSEFEEFKNSSDNSWLEEYGILHAIADNKYDGDDWYMNWSKEDQDLIPLVQKGDKKAMDRYVKIGTNNYEKIDLYKFKQFIASKQADNDKLNSSIEKISDRIVSQSSFDILTNRDIFLDDWCIGSKGGGYRNTPQLWGTPVIDPNSLFNPDGSLGKGGEYIKRKFQTALDGVDNIRVDHVFAYANPYVYRRSFADNPNNWKMDYVNGNEIHYIDTSHIRGNAGFMLDKHFEWDKNQEYVSRLNIPGKENYRRIIPEIILPALREMGFDESDIDKIAWETLGDWNPVFTHEIRPENKLNGMFSLRYMPGRHQELHNGDYALIGSHDDPPAQYLARNPQLGANGVWDKEYLAQFLSHSKDVPRDRAGRVKVDSIPLTELTKAKYVDLFTSGTDKFALNFNDFFGINEQPNVPGTNDYERPENWTLRLPQDYDEKYYQALSDFRKEYAINIPEVLRMSIEYKLDNGEIPTGEIHYAREIINRLSKWEQILKEPER